MKFALLSILTLSMSAFAGQVDLKKLNKGDLIDICSNVCGEEYAQKAEIRDFFQLKVYKDKISQSGLTCFKKTSWASEGTPCHARKFHKGIHRDGLAPSKTELHTATHSLKQNGGWCIAYNEEDFAGMKKSVDNGDFKPGQVVCVSGVDLESVKTN